MPKITVTVDIADFLANGPAPLLAYVTFARATLDSVTGEVITTTPISVRAEQPPLTVQLDSGVAYRVRAYGVRGLTDAFFALTTASCTLSALYRSHQVDPGALQPILDPPATVAELLEQAVAILTGGAGGALSGQYPNPGLNEAALDSAVAARVSSTTSSTGKAVQALIDAATALITLAKLGGVDQAGVDGRISALADPKGAASAITLVGLGGLDQPGVDARVALLSDPKGAAAAITLAGLGGATPAAVDARIGVLADPKGAAAAVTLSGLGGITPAAVDAKVATQHVADDAAYAKQSAVAASLAGKADLVGGLIPSSQIPAIALHTTVPVASQAAMLALTPAQVQPGDVAVVQSTDSSRGSWQLGGNGDPSVLGNWTLLVSPVDAVTTVNGLQGTVVLGPGDVGADPAGAAAAVTLATLGALARPTAAGVAGQQLRLGSGGTPVWATPLTVTDNGDGTATIG